MAASSVSVSLNYQMPTNDRETTANQAIKSQKKKREREREDKESLFSELENQYIIEWEKRQISNDDPRWDRKERSEI